MESGADIVAPRTPAEELLANLYSEVLHVERVSVEDNFFDLGGHSLLATQLISRVRQVFRLEVPLRLLFERPTVAALAEGVETLLHASHSVSTASPLERIAREGPLPLSFAQQRLWFIDQLEGGSAFYNMPVTLRLTGELDVAALEQAFNEIICRHETLRTVFTAIDGTPSQIIQPASPLPALSARDLSALTVEEREAEVERLAREEAQHRFELSRGPMLRVSVLRAGEHEHVVILTMHHIVSDAWSMGVLVREVAALYEAYSQGLPSPLPELPIQYADYAHWQREWLSGDVLEQQLSYWREQLGGELPVLELPTDRARPSVQSYRGGQLSFEVNEEVTTRLKELSQRQGATLFMTLLSAFQVLLMRYSSQEDVIVGTAVAGRTRKELESLVGFFVNTLVLRTDLSGDPTFEELVGRVREVCLGAYAHQDIPFERLVEELQPERSLSLTPLFQVMFVLQNAPAERLRLPQVLIDSTVTPGGLAKFDITLEISEADENLSISVNYNADLFERATVERLSRHYQSLLAGIVSNPRQRLSRLPLLSDEERRQLLVAWNQTQQPYPRHKCIHELFEEQAERTPDAVALIYGDEQVSYEVLNRRANQVAHRLRRMGVGPEVRVGICLRRSVEMVAGLLGVLKAGGAYVPLDAEYPEERLRWMMEDAAVQVVLTQERFVERLLKHCAQVMCLDTERTLIARESTHNPAGGAAALSLAYVMYTSGSTGEPKGVSVVHRGVVRLVKETNYVELNPDEVFLQFAPITFDASTFEIWGCLLNGARLVIMPPSVPPLEELGEALRRYRITTLWLTSGLFHQMVDQRLDDLQCVRQLLAGGDVLSVSHVRKFLRRAQRGRLVNGYGPTENTTFTCCHQIADESEISSSVPIGRPISNTQVYILDQHQQPVPVGVAGELYIGGDGLARDYLNRPDLTAERFVAHPYATDEGARLYRTGDRARYLGDGRIEFLGRVDGQVKLRGYRIELGEVEAVLCRHPAVQEAAAFIQEDEFDDKRIVACCVAKKEGAPSARELRRFLQERLPAFMIPSAFVMLDELPLTPNGKVDRAALPAFEPAAEKSAGHLAPRTPVEELLAGTWAEILKVPRVSVHDNFFELGGHSLLATKIVSRIREVFQVEVGLRALFSAPTVAGVAEHVEAALRDEQAAPIAPIQNVRRDRPLPLSFAQQRLWFIDQMEPGNVAYNIHAAVRFRGHLDVCVLEQTLSEIIRRHEALRTTVAVVDEQLVQLIAEPVPLSLPVVDVSGLAEGERGAEAQRLAAEEAHRPFDIARGPLLRVSLIRVGEEEHVLLCTMHHIIGDGWSILVLMREMKALYEAFSIGAPAPLAGLSIQYADYAAWQREWLQGEVLERQLAYWERQLRDAPPVLQLPADKPRPARQTYRGESRTLLLPGELGQSLKELSRKESATLFMTLLAAFQLLLHRYTGQDDIVVGTPIAGRNRSELESLIGFFVNTLALRCDLSGDPSFRELLGRVREVSLGAYTHQELPFEKVLEELQPERSLGHTPVFQVFFNMLNLEFEKIELPGLTAEYLATTDIGSKFDLTLYVEELSDAVSLRLVYNTDLFSRDQMAELLEQYRHLLRQVARDPNTKISRFSLITPAAQAILPDPAEPLDDGWVGSVHSLFSEHARRSPQAVAVADEDDSWTYQELDSRSNQLAHHLLARGIRVGDIVAIYAHRSASLVWALLGVLKAGAGFAILDPSYPDMRLLEYLRVAKPKELLVLSEAGKLPDELEEFLESDGSGRLELPRRSAAARAGFLSDYSSGLPGVHVGPDDLAYVSFTSGTTGTPKAILGRHGSLTHFLPWLKETFDLNESDAFSMLSGLSHDPLHRDVFTPLQLGGRICIPGPEVIETPGRLARWMKQERVSVAHLTPAMGRLLTEATAEGAGGEVPSLRYAFFVGDVLTKRDVSLVQKLAPAATCVNYYGATETQRAVGYYVVRNERMEISDGGRAQRRLRKETIPLGWGIRDVQLLVLNQARQLAGIGEAGEIYLRSPHLALGYLGDEALSRERFIPNPFTQAAGDRLYKTGDLGRYLPDGSVEPLGRADHQVKVRGYRVELSEIEIALGSHPAVSEAVVVAREDAAGDKQLVAYVVPGSHEAVGLSALREFTRRRLPDYMVPASFVLLDGLPLTPNRKVDRAALPAPEQVESAAGLVAPRTPVEELLAGMYADLLKVPRVSIDDNFFELGGHSLLGIQLMSRVHRDFQVELPLRTLFESPTVAELALLVEQRKAAHQASGAAVRTIRRRESKRVEELLAELGQETVAGDEGDKEIPLTRG
ncbi:MAG TPA: amino acid adenylation domain-containing protein [Pyrinomonadaceae bacterium]